MSDVYLQSAISNEQSESKEWSRKWKRIKWEWLSKQKRIKSDRETKENDIISESTIRNQMRIKQSENQELREWESDEESENFIINQNFRNTSQSPFIPTKQQKQVSFEKESKRKSLDAGVDRAAEKDWQATSRTASLETRANNKKAKVFAYTRELSNQSISGLNLFFKFQISTNHVHKIISIQIRIFEFKKLPYPECIQISFFSSRTSFKSLFTVTKPVSGFSGTFSHQSYMDITLRW